MLELDKRYPEYQFAKHKGYPTASSIDLWSRAVWPVARPSTELFDQDLAEGRTGEVRRTSSRSQGQLGELEAARYLRSIGYEMIASNYRCRFGEIDIIALDGSITVFVEVKTRSPDSLVRPLEAVTRQKQQRLCKAALHHLAQHSTDRPTRFDVIEVTSDGSFPACVRINHIKHAFEAGENHAFF